MNNPDTITNDAAQPKFPLLLRIAAYFFSYVFHPLFIPLIAAWYLAFIHEGYFIGISQHDKVFILLRVAANTILFPGATILLLKSVGFIKSIFLKSRRERIVPFVAANIFYFWMYLVFHNQPEVPSVLTAFILGIFLASSAGFFANIYYKISMHALGMGALCGLVLVIIYSNSVYPVFPAAMVIFLLTGLVSTSRLMISDHTPFDIYTGIIFGIICQVIAAAFIGINS
ncbi:MAG TPA: hypothetical protein VG847_06915 [Chitinophagaceae bacterium]|nr:hypothetical protein [Chitinophagaceae bacterium]